MSSCPVSWEDQQSINRFSRLNNERMALSSAIAKLEEEQTILEECRSELEIVQLEGDEQEGSGVVK